MKKLLLIISILGTLTVGCENKSVEKEEKASTDETTHTNKKESLSDYDYRTKFNKSLEDIEPFTSGYVTTVIETPIQMDNEEWRKKVNNILNGYEVVSNDMIPIEAPQKYSKMHEIQKEAEEFMKDYLNR